MNLYCTRFLFPCYHPITGLLLVACVWTLMYIAHTSFLFPCYLPSQGWFFLPVHGLCVDLVMYTAHTRSIHPASMFLLSSQGWFITVHTHILPLSMFPLLSQGWFILPVACFMVVVFLFLVFLPLLLQPIPSLVAFSVILLGVPVYLCLVMERPRLRPKVFDDISGKLI